MLEKFCKWNINRSARWKKVRLKGKTHFIWFRGVFGWGLCMFLFSTTFYYIQRLGFSLPTSENFPYNILIINVVICPIAGYIWGAWTWSLTEKSYQNYLEEKSNI